ncbi:DUF2058 domain-containing protein [Shewanella dokdonensis]|uniref:DUF2058 domain-containing protein n=1 Tax=Shewanella dokdonensis TaxID=712036 RepID=A0ABX8DEW9_9GAMM|nr:DUF2058 domain-containing protein [Shewanella dokdonensis]MCL1072931.1 DUF2058 domain-containing protein [Shewanella dokdonensis]QVK23143.1 DUF2058 domain-containing protein [Shewanella dokdonensis]
MANALQEQLLKAGLTNKQKIKDVKTQKKRNRKANVDDGSEALKQQVAAQKAEQAKRDKQLNEQRFAEASEKGLVRSLISEIKRKAVSVPSDGEIKFNYTLLNKIYPLYLNSSLQQQLLNGKLGIVRLEDHSYLVPHKLAERVNLLVPDWVGYLWQADSTSSQPQDAEDPYADYVIPDDLMW